MEIRTKHTEYWVLCNIFQVFGSVDYFELNAVRTSYKKHYYDTDFNILIQNFR